MTDAIITTHQLYHTYQTGALQKAALTDISIEIMRGQCAAIIGITGSGKSTLVQHFNGLLHPTSGSILVDGIDVSAKKVDLVRLRQKVGMLFQFPESQLFERTIYKDIAFGPQRMKLAKHEIRSRVIRAMEIVGLPHQEFANRSPFGLSGGQMRRIALAGVLAMAPSILILDEPTTGLDADARREFYFYLQRIKEEGVTIILVSHDMTEVATLADQLFVLHNGQLVMQGTPRTIFALADQLKTYGLATPPLSELLSLLRKYGLAIPDEIFTLEESYKILESLTKKQRTR